MTCISQEAWKETQIQKLTGISIGIDFSPLKVHRDFQTCSYASHTSKDFSMSRRLITKNDNVTRLWMESSSTETRKQSAGEPQMENVIVVVSRRCRKQQVSKVRVED